jgi:hypothetical protein
MDQHRTKTMHIPSEMNGVPKNVPFHVMSLLYM